MIETTEIEIDGRAVEVSIRRPNMIESFIIAGQIPEMEDPDNPTLREVEEVGTFLIRNYTDIPDPLIDQLPMETFCGLVEDTVEAIEGWCEVEE